MDVKTFVNKLFGISSDVTCLEKALVFSFANKKNLDIRKSRWLKKYLRDVDGSIVEKIRLIAIEDFSLSDLVSIFELLIPQFEKKERGVVYTPTEIASFIVKHTLDYDFIPTVLDPSCGCGAFLVTAAEYMHQRYDAAYSDIVSSYLYGIDVDSDAIDRIKSLLSLQILLNGENEKCTFNFLCADALDVKTYDKMFKLRKDGYDCVVGNPPYVRNKNMNEETKKFLSNWKSSNVGNVDLYIPFFEIGLGLLSINGRLGYITPNSYIQSVNSRNLRSFFESKKHKIEIIDFRDCQIFENVTSYTCITFVDKSVCADLIAYCRVNEKNSLENHSFSEYYYHDFPGGKPWRMRDRNIDEMILKLENSDYPLSKWKIRNGLATLKNDVYFFSPIKDDKTYYYREFNGKTYKIEKKICIKVAKPNVIKDETDLKQKMEVAIFPYLHSGKSYSIIEESFLQSSYPETYMFLTECKSLLLNRDKGKGDYPAWYAYGRTQGMNNFGKKLLIPYISGSPVAVLSLDPEVLFYCGYALLSEDEEELKILKIFLESEAFWYYVFHTSKPYSKGYMAFAKNYIINFSIPALSKKEKKHLLSLRSRKQKDDFVWKKYL